MDYRWLAVPALLIVALGVAVFLNQPKVSDVGDLGYIDVNGDEYLPEDYITPDEEGIGDTEYIGPKSTYDFPATIADCTGRVGGDRDTCLLLYSVMNEDGSGCGEMADSSLRDDCYYKAATVNNNETFCENVTLGKQRCYIDIAISTKNAGLCEKGRMNVDKCYDAVKAGDMAKCADSDDRKRCNDAVFYKDSTKCALLEREDAYCYYAIATENSNAALCAKAGVSSGTCYFKIATETNNAAICNNLTDSKDNCVATVAYNTGNTQLCYQAGAERQSCLEDIATR